MEKLDLLVEELINEAVKFNNSKELYELIKNKKFGVKISDDMYKNLDFYTVDYCYKQFDNYDIKNKLKAAQFLFSKFIDFEDLRKEIKENKDIIFKVTRVATQDSFKDDDILKQPFNLMIWRHTAENSEYSKKEMPPKVYSDSMFELYKVTTFDQEKAIAWYGKNWDIPTHWCTRANEGHFDDYSSNGKEPYWVIRKNDGHTWQAVFSDDGIEFMDEQDDRPSEENFQEFSKTWPKEMQKLIKSSLHKVSFYDAYHKNENENENENKNKDKKILNQNKTLKKEKEDIKNEYIKNDRPIIMVVNNKIIIEYLFYIGYDSAILEIYDKYKHLFKLGKIVEKQPELKKDGSVKKGYKKISYQTIDNIYILNNHFDSDGNGKTLNAKIINSIRENEKIIKKVPAYLISYGDAEFMCVFSGYDSKKYKTLDFSDAVKVKEGSVKSKKLPISVDIFSKQDNQVVKHNQREREIEQERFNNNSINVNEFITKYKKPLMENGFGEFKQENQGVYSFKYCTAKKANGLWIVIFGSYKVRIFKPGDKMFNVLNSISEEYRKYYQKVKNKEQVEKIKQDRELWKKGETRPRPYGSVKTKNFNY